MEDELEILLAEYKVCNDKAHSNNSVCWQIGAILITASILMLSSSVQVFPNSVGMLLVPVAWMTLCTWYMMYKRFNWLCQRSYDRAKAIEALFIDKKRSGNATLKNQETKATTSETTMINSWIKKLDDEGKAEPRSIVPIKWLIGTVVLVSVLILISYFVYYFC